MKIKRPYFPPLSEIIAVQASNAILTASNEGFPVTPVTPFSSSMRPTDDFDSLTF